jgi:hypothetical protein
MIRTSSTASAKDRWMGVKNRGAESGMAEWEYFNYA